MTTERMSLEEVRQITWQTICDDLPDDLRGDQFDLFRYTKKIMEIHKRIRAFIASAREYLSDEEVAFLRKESGFHMDSLLDSCQNTLDEGQEPPEEILQWLEGYMCGFVGMVRATLVHINEEEYLKEKIGKEMEISRLSRVIEQTQENIETLEDFEKQYIGEPDKYQDLASVRRALKRARKLKKENEAQLKLVL